MGICLSQVGREKPFFSSVPVGEEPRTLSGMDCDLYEKYLWVLKKYPLRPDTSSVVVAVTDFTIVSFHLSEYQDISERAFYVLTPRYIRRLSYRQIIGLVENKTPMG